MSGPTPLTSPYRLSLLYTATSFQHKSRYFLDVSAGTGPSGFDTQPRGGFANVDLQTGVDKVFTKLAPFYNPSFCTFDGWLLELLSGTQFIPAGAGTTTVVPTGSAPVEPANQLAITGKDLNNKNLPTYFYEGQFGVAFKGSSPASMASVLRQLVNIHYNIDATAVAADPYAWSWSRDQKFRFRWLAAVIDTNEKLRRARGIK
jgi:hypothetical protein